MQPALIHLYETQTCMRRKLRTPMSVLTDQAELGGYCNGLETSMRIELCEYGTHVGSNRRQADTELLRHRAGIEAVRHKVQHFKLACTESLQVAILFSISLTSSPQCNHEARHGY